MTLAATLVTIVVTVVVVDWNTNPVGRAIAFVVLIVIGVGVNVARYRQYRDVRRGR